MVDEEGRELVNPPSKSMCSNAMLLQEANSEMESHFETHLKVYIINIKVESETQDFEGGKG